MKRWRQNINSAPDNHSSSSRRPIPRNCWHARGEFSSAARRGSGINQLRRRGSVINIASRRRSVHHPAVRSPHGTRIMYSKLLHRRQLSIPGCCRYIYQSWHQSSTPTPGADSAHPWIPWMLAPSQGPRSLLDWLLMTNDICNKSYPGPHFNAPITQVEGRNVVWMTRKYFYQHFIKSRPGEIWRHLIYLCTGTSTMSPFCILQSTFSIKSIAKQMVLCK